MKDPAFLFYSSDFLSGVQDLTMEERGQYITLLCLQHQKGHLTDKMIRLCCGNAAADVMAKFRQDSAGFWYNERLEQEIEKRKIHSEKQRNRAKNGWEKRKSNATAYATACATAMPLENENENINENVIEVKEEEEKQEKFDFKKSLIQHGVEKQIAEDWMKVRKNKKATNTETAFNALKNQIDISGLQWNDCIKIAAEKSWAGFKAEWVSNDKNYSYGKQTNSQSTNTSGFSRPGYDPNNGIGDGELLSSKKRPVVF